MEGIEPTVPAMRLDPQDIPLSVMPVAQAMKDMCKDRSPALVLEGDDPLLERSVVFSFNGLCCSKKQFEDRRVSQSTLLYGNSKKLGRHELPESPDVPFQKR